MAATASRLTTVSRRLTAQRGLAGFTLEELCEEVGVSRRTFFNYFPSKEEAVLGIDEAEQLRRFSERFHDRGSRGWVVVLDDLVDLTLAHVAENGLDFSEHSDFAAALDREPKLLVRVMGVTRERERDLARLIAEREGADAGDPRARAVVHLFITVLRTAAGDVIAHAALDTDDGGDAVPLPGARGSSGEAAASDDFGTALRSALDAVRAVLTPTIPRKDTP